MEEKNRKIQKEKGNERKSPDGRKDREKKKLSKTERFLDAVSKMSRVWKIACILAVVTLYFIQFMFMLGDMFDVWKDWFSKAAAVVFFISIHISFSFFVGIMFDGRYLIVSGKDGKTGQTLVPHFADMPIDVEELLILLKQRFRKNFNRIIPLSVLMFLVELLVEIPKIAGQRRLMPAIPSMGKLIWFIIQIACLILFYRTGQIFFSKLLKSFYEDKRTGYDMRDEREDKEKYQKKKHKREKQSGFGKWIGQIAENWKKMGTMERVLHVAQILLSFIILFLVICDLICDWESKKFGIVIFLLGIQNVIGGILYHKKGRKVESVFCFICAIFIIACCLAVLLENLLFSNI
ncbi:MAG: hypothetical protein PUC12_11485 [Clostridiales bacterium]|nr:hypothetical protein [Clostridiales bacterium]